ncbi:MAG TPA: DoxX family protein [Fibrobacteraceae bacterium]|mgnify:FL=1|nr:DoxX family protein [Fibrobacteraceae bacterium]
MKKILDLCFNPGEYSNNISLSLLFLRLIVGGFMLTHGIGKWMMLIGDGPIRFADPIGIGVTASLALTVFAEVFCSLFLIFGFATRLAVIPLVITMLVATIVVHGADGFGKQELPLLYASIYVFLAVMGSGKFSVDQYLYKKIPTD